MHLGTSRRLVERGARMKASQLALLAGRSTRIVVGFSQGLVLANSRSTLQFGCDAPGHFGGCGQVECQE